MIFDIEAMTAEEYRLYLMVKDRNDPEMLRALCNVVTASIDSAQELKYAQEEMDAARDELEDAHIEVNKLEREIDRLEDEVEKLQETIESLKEGDN